MSFAGAISDYHDGGLLRQNIHCALPRSPEGRVQIVIPRQRNVKRYQSQFVSRPVFLLTMKHSLNRVLLKLNQGADFRNKEDELSLMFKDNRFERFIPECLVKGKTMVFCAGTGAGKTTFANACLQYIPIICDVFQ
jgi:type IV secretion system protein VirB11